MLLLQYSSLLVLPRPARDHLEFLLDGLDQRLRASGGAQGETFDRSVRAHVLAALGRRDEAMADARNALAWIRRTEDLFAGGPVLHNLALAFDAMGERDRAVALLEEAAPLWSFPAGLMALDPMAAELVQDPRVAALIREARSGP